MACSFTSEPPIDSMTRKLQKSPRPVAIIECKIDLFQELCLGLVSLFIISIFFCLQQDAEPVQFNEVQSFQTLVRNDSQQPAKFHIVAVFAISQAFLQIIVLRLLKLWASSNNHVKLPFNALLVNLAADGTSTGSN